MEPFGSRRSAVCSWPVCFVPTFGTEGKDKSFSIRDIEVISVSGKQVEVIASTAFDPGRHSVEWTPQNVANGTYVLRCTIGERSSTSKLVLMR